MRMYYEMYSDLGAFICTDEEGPVLSVYLEPEGHWTVLTMRLSIGALKLAPIFAEWFASRVPGRVVVMRTHDFMDPCNPFDEKEVFVG